MNAAATLATEVGIAPACRALGVPRATFYRRRKPATGRQQPTRSPARALSAAERERVRETLASPRFVDRSPAEVMATLLDEGHYLCSERTMYRILAEDHPVRERRNQLTHPEYPKPELVATAPNQTWSWDITRLLGSTTWTYYYLYVLLDIFSRYVVGWMVADRENSALAASGGRAPAPNRSVRGPQSDRQHRSFQSHRPTHGIPDSPQFTPSSGQFCP